MVGHDFSGHRTGTPKPGEPDAAYLQQAEPKKWPNGIDTAWRGVVTRDGWKYVRTPRERWLLFDLNADPYEMNNLVFDSRVCRKTGRELHDRLRRFVGGTGDEFPPGRDRRERPAVCSAGGMASSSNKTTDHDEIKKWAESRGGKPAAVEGTDRSGGDPGLIRLMFPDSKQADDDRLTEISWDDFFEKFDESGLALIYQEETSGGEKSSFNKLVKRD